MIIVRKAKTEDAKQIKDLCFELMLRFEKMDPFDAQDKKYWKTKAVADFKKLIRKRNSNFFVLEENKKLIGFIETAINKREYAKIKENGHIELLYIKPKHRGKGYSKRLMEESIRWFEQRKTKYVTVGTHALDKGANSFWEKHGFKDYNLKYVKTIQ